MECPKCKSTNIQVITEKYQKYYCTSCNYAWDIKNGDNESEGELELPGSEGVRNIFNVLLKDQEIPLEIRATIECQLEAALYELWFGGYKAGKLTTLIYTKDSYGKDRDGTNQSIRNSEIRNDGPQEKDSRATRGCQRATTRPGQRRRAQDGGTERFGATEVRNRIGPVELISPRNIKIPESIEKTIAYLTQNVWTNLTWIKNVHYDGHLTIEINTSGNRF